MCFVPITRIKFSIVVFSQPIVSALLWNGIFVEGWILIWEAIEILIDDVD
jgi:hypothetical protein